MFFSLVLVSVLALDLIVVLVYFLVQIQYLVSRVVLVMF